MKYDFPVITHINDVLPYIVDHPEFIVLEKAGYTVINYKVALKDSFTIVEHYSHEHEVPVLVAQDIGGIIRRECRGIMFDDSGKIISRPFHKFFNVDEREETFVDNINESKISHIEVKLDGTMIRPVLINGEIRWCTKSGITEHSRGPEEYVSKRPQIRYFAEMLIRMGKTGLFEWTAPDNRIVVGYDRPQLRLLAIRDNVSGRYQKVGWESRLTENLDETDRNDLPCGLGSFLKMAREEEQGEGYVIVMKDGHRMKVKNDRYCRIHKCLEDIRFDFYIGQHILAGTLDDLKPFLSDSDAEHVADYEKRFSELYEGQQKRIGAIAEAVSGMTKKEAATGILKAEDSWTRSVIFKVMQGADVKQAVTDVFLKNVGGQSDHQKLMEWKY